jgi:hypothetical protein
MIGYKRFNDDTIYYASNEGFPIEIGKTYVIDESNKGFRFCRYSCDILDYYDYDFDIFNTKIIDDNYKYAIIETNIPSNSDDGLFMITNNIKIIKLITKDELMRLTPNIIYRNNGTKEYYKDGLLHREDRSAIEYPNGSKSWYINGLLHREDGPAIQEWTGEKRW